jgi:hypothetical protein
VEKMTKISTEDCASSCINCSFYSPFSLSVERGSVGECRRHSPRLTLTLDNLEREYPDASFPCVAGDDWCGEFAPRTCDDYRSQNETSNLDEQIEAWDSYACRGRYEPVYRLTEKGVRSLGGAPGSDMVRQDK